MVYEIRVHTHTRAISWNPLYLIFQKGESYWMTGAVNAKKNHLPDFSALYYVVTVNIFSIVLFSHQNVKNK